MYNLLKVIKFEIVRQVKKISFWISIFIFPIMMLIFGGVGYFNAKLVTDQKEITKQETKTVIKNVAIVNHVKNITIKGPSDLKLSFFQTEKQGTTEFKNNHKIDALIIYPANFSQDEVKVFNRKQDSRQQTDKIASGTQAIARSMLQQALVRDIDPNTIELIKTEHKIRINQTIFEKDNSIYNPTAKMIVPGVFLAVFFLLFMISTNQTLLATTEEKENRISEMLLTTLSAKTLIVAKIIASILLGLVQAASVIVPMLLFLKFGSNLVLGDNGQTFKSLFAFLSSAEFEFWPIFFGASFLLLGFLLTTSFVILIGSMFQTAQEAAKALTPITLSLILPMYFIGAISSGVDNIIITILSFFPLTSPITMLTKNTFGSLTPQDGLISLGVMAITTIVVMFLAIQTFKRSLFEYNRNFSLKEVLSK